MSETIKLTSVTWDDRTPDQVTALRRDPVTRVVIPLNVPLSPAEVAAFLIPSRPRLRLLTPSERNELIHAERIIASIPDPQHITAATLRARQPREADRTSLPLP